MINWRQISKTDRICIICSVTIDDEKGLQVVPYRRPIILNNDRRLIVMLIRYVFLPFMSFTVIAGIVLIMAFIVEKIFKIQLRSR